VLRATAAAAVVVLAMAAAVAFTGAGAAPLDTEGTIWLVRPATAPRAATMVAAWKVEAFVNCICLCFLTVL
jgi:hypothetical protein